LAPFHGARNNPRLDECSQLPLNSAGTGSQHPNELPLVESPLGMTEQSAKHSLPRCAEERPSNTVEGLTFGRSHFGYYRTYIRVIEATLSSAMSR